jgi:hypothetical protein
MELAMIAPLADRLAIGDGASMVIAFAIGIAFGWTLERAGLGSARKLMGQFYLTDFTVFKVMFTAILTAMLGTFWLARVGVLDLSALYVPETFVAPQLVGGVVFGIGFALAGLCPGTSCVAAATGRGDGLAVVAGMLSGVTLTGLAFDRLRGFYESGARGAFTLPQLLHLPYGVVVFGIVALALVGFRVTTLIAKGTVDVDARPKRHEMVMGTAAIVLSVTAVLVGSPRARTVDPVNAIHLARWIHDRQPGLRVIDLRSAAAFDDYHLPTAEHLPIGSGATLALSPGQIVVFYAERDDEAIAAARAVRGDGRAYALAGGVQAWTADVMGPTLPEGASAKDRAAFAEISALSRYFGGTPRTGVSARESRPTAQQFRKRGC